MDMDPRFIRFNGFRNYYNTDGGVITPNSSGLPLDFSGDNQLLVPSLDTTFSNSSLEIPPDPNPGNFDPSLQLSPNGGPSSGPANLNPWTHSLTSSDDNEFFEPVLNYISQTLMEENIEEEGCVLHDPLALQETEKSLYEALEKKYPFSADQPQQYLDRIIESPLSHFSFNDSITNSSSNGSSNSTDSHGFAEAGDFSASWIQTLESSNCLTQPALPSIPWLSFNPSNHLTDNVNRFLQSSVNSFNIQNLFGDEEPALLFKKGLQEASQFLPHNGELFMNVDKNASAMGQKEDASKVEGNLCRGRKNHERQDADLQEERSNKQSAAFVEEIELSEMLDRVLLGSYDNQSMVKGAEKNEANETAKSSGRPHGSQGRKGRSRKQGKKETVDLRNLLILCAQAISTDDRRSATELLKQIRQHSTPFGDASERLAHYFANALETRLDGLRNETRDFYTSQTIEKTPVADALKAFQLYLSFCPFRKLSIFFANKMILSVAEKAKTLHIVDFGILDGFQWPILIQLLSNRPGGPPKLRITGIELPQSGFRPTERIDKTGSCLANYCDRFGVPFEYNGIASQKWETIQIEDLKIDGSEVLAVNCPLRFKNLLDESVEVNSPRDAVLKLIRKTNPSIVVHSILNGSHNTPFFLTRFREALFHFSALFDMFEVNVPRENEQRLAFERKFYGRDIINIVACEGSERVERPETYRQWQLRNIRAGFKLLSLDQELMKNSKAKLKESYNKDFVIDEDNNWMLLGWRGRILYASSCWVPA